MEINKSILISKIEEFKAQVLIENKPYKWVMTEEPFQNIYGKLCFDYSGKVEPMELDEYNSKILNNELDDIYIDQWEATYTSNMGKAFITYEELIRDKYTTYLYENYPIYNEETEEYDDDLEMKLEDVFYEYFNK